jgi:hypothetical protein
MPGLKSFRLLQCILALGEMKHVNQARTYGRSDDKLESSRLPSPLAEKTTDGHRDQGSISSNHET